MALFKRKLGTPRPAQLAFLLSVCMSAWLSIRDDGLAILKALEPRADAAILRHLFEVLIPSAVLGYRILLRSGNADGYVMHEAFFASYCITHQHSNYQNGMAHAIGIKNHLKATQPDAHHVLTQTPHLLDEMMGEVRMTRTGHAKFQKTDHFLPFSPISLPLFLHSPRLAATLTSRGELRTTRATMSQSESY